MKTTSKTSKKLTALLASTILATRLTACNDKEPAAQKPTSTIEQLKQAGKVRIGVFSDKPRGISDFQQSGYYPR